MGGYQAALFKWVVAQPTAIGGLILACGLLALFHGMRFVRPLIMLQCGMLGYLLGLLIADRTNATSPLVTWIPCLASAAFGFFRTRAATLLAGAATWGLVAAYAGHELGLCGWPLWLVFGSVAGGATLLAAVEPRPTTVVLTCVQGAALTIVGLTGVTYTLLPDVGVMLRSWGVTDSLMIPFLLAALTVAGNSHQSNQLKGDIRFGAPGGTLEGSLPPV